MMYLVYILYSADLNRYYIGHTAEPMTERLRKHLSNHSGYTSKAKDGVKQFVEQHPSKKEAYARELFIKRKESIQFIQNIISSTR